MDIEQKLKELKEQRVTQARKKDLYKKLTTVCVGMGQPIISSTEDYSEFDYFSEEVVESDAGGYVTGYQFYALQFGCNLEILYYPEESNVKVNYNGYKVYEESEGDLQCYTPGAEWEAKIEHWYPAAEKRLKGREEKNQEEALEESKSILTKLKEELRMRWGF